MKKHILFTLMSSCSFLLAEPTVVNFLSLNGEQMQTLMQNQDNDFILELPAKTVLPVRFFLQGDTAVFTAKETDIGQIELQKTIYLQRTEEELLLSSDLQNWLPFLEFFTGNFSVQLGIDPTGHSISFSAETNERK